MSFRSSILDPLFGWLGYLRAQPAQIVEWSNRGGLYAVNQLLYDNRAYLTRANGGALENILAAYFGRANADVTLFPITGHFSPFKEVVDVYQNCIPGTWGRETKVADKVDDRPVNPRLPSALGEVWKASNLDTEKQKLQRWAANFGTVGMRITADADKGRVSVRCDHPSRLFNFEEDSDGNVVAMCLKYNDQPVNYGTLVDPDYQYPEIIETITKDENSVTIDGAEQLKGEARRNVLGFCPYVLLRHKDNGTPYGDWAYKGIEAGVHAINWRITRQGKAIDRNELPKWFGAGGGDKPESVDLGDTTMTYVKLDPDTPAPFLQAVVPTLHYTEIRQCWEALIELVRRYCPEININDVRLLAGISGESLAQVLKATEAMVLMARPAYQHALKRALQMAVSAGMVMRIEKFNIGIGLGEGAGDSAFQQGLEDFDFATAPALPLTTFQQIQLATAAVAEDKAKFDLATAAQRTGVVSDRQVMRHAGMNDQQIKQNEKEIGQFDLQDPAATQDFASGNGSAR